jgi:type II secretory pathway pseudopilin PulG
MSSLSDPINKSVEKIASVSNSSEDEDLQDNHSAACIKEEDPFEESKKITPVIQQSTMEKKEPIKKRQGVSKLSIILVILIVVLLSSIVIMLLLKPTALKKENNNLLDQFREAQKQLKEYQIKIQQLTTDNAELNAARISEAERANKLKEMYQKEVAEKTILINSQSTMKKPKSLKEQKTAQYEKSVNPNNQEKEKTVEVAKMFDMPDNQQRIAGEYSDTNIVEDSGFIDKIEEEIDVDGAFDDSI